MSFICFLPFRFLRYRKDRRRCLNPKTSEKSPAIRVAEPDQEHYSTGTTLEKLPVEILQHIASFLAPDAAACFTLCSKSLRWAVGYQSWYELRTKDQKKARLSFLLSLQRDLREWLLCYRCEKLRPFDLKPDSHTTWTYSDEPPCTEGDGFVYLLPLFGLRFQYAQMIMKQHKLGATDNIYLDSLSHAHVSIFEHEIPHGCTSARIANGNLLVKLEWRILLHHGEGFRRLTSLSPDNCPHLQCCSIEDKITRRIRCLMDHGPGQYCAVCTGIKQCQHCSTEFVIACLDSSWSPQSHAFSPGQAISRGQAVYVTAWENFGPCDTPFDIRWRSQTWRGDSSLPPPESSTPFVPGSIRRAFEDIAGSKIRVDGLSSLCPLDSDVEFAKLLAGFEN
ncbi:hypothetical protein MMC24_005346 [Lignoscripta atroalba]|nr:hypothetical protein [Lignoscripta atroalba]